MTSATQILRIDLLTDSGPALVLGMEPPDRGIMQAPPCDPRTRVVGAAASIDIVLAAIVMAAGTLLAMNGPESRSSRSTAGRSAGCPLALRSGRRQCSPATGRLPMKRPVRVILLIAAVRVACGGEAPRSSPSSFAP